MLDRRVRVMVLGAVLGVLAVLGAIVSVSAPRCPGDCPPGSVSASVEPTAPARVPAVVTIAPNAAAREVDPLSVVLVTAQSGTLSEVVMVNEAGNRIAGVMTPDNTVWKPGAPLAYGKAYTLTATANGNDGT